MKRTLIFLAGAVAVGMTVYFSNHLRAQPQDPNQVQPATNVAPLRTRIAVINLSSVIKNYQKWSTFEQEYKAKYDGYNKLFEQEKNQATALKAQFDKATDEQTRETIQVQMKELERKLQDMGERAKRELGKLRDDQVVQIYREVEMAVQAYARANDIEMVLHYNDAIVASDLYHPVNISRKLQNNACMPMYYAPGMDITNTIVAMLNQRLGGLAPAGAQQR